MLFIGPLTPTGFNVKRVYEETSNTTVTLEWDLPQGSGAEAIVDFYNISITPRPLSHPKWNAVYSAPWNVTLSYNVEYTVTITAVNCAGESNTVVLPNVEYSKSLWVKSTILLYCSKDTQRDIGFVL